MRLHGARATDGEDVHARLRAARRLVAAGRLGEARLACAALLRAELPRVAADPALLRLTTALLISARAPEQARRLFVAAWGRELPCAEAPARSGSGSVGVAQPQRRRQRPQPLDVARAQ